MPAAEVESTRVSVADILGAVQAQAAAVTAETAGYILLLALREVTAAGQRPKPETLLVDCEGGLSLGAGEQAGSLADTEGQLRQLLGRFLRFVGSAGPALAAIESPPELGCETLLEVELLSALVPLNEAAARRGVARLCRQTEKWLLGRRGEDWPVCSVPGRSGGTDGSRNAVAPCGPLSSLDAGAGERAAPAIVQPVSAMAQDPHSSLQCDLSARRSDLSELIARYLSEPRSEQGMAHRLRQCVGLTH